MIGPLLWLIYLVRLLIQILKARCLAADYALCIHGFQRQRSNFDKKCTFSKVKEQKENLLINFRIKFEDCMNWTYIWKSCQKLARRSSSGRLKTTRNMYALMFFYFVIFIHKLDIIRKEQVIWLQNFLGC